MTSRKSLATYLVYDFHDLQLHFKQILMPLSKLKAIKKQEGELSDEQDLAYDNSVFHD